MLPPGSSVSLPSRERGSKPVYHRRWRLHRWSLPSRERGSKLERLCAAVVGLEGRSLRGSADRNRNSPQHDGDSACRSLRGSADRNRSVSGVSAYVATSLPSRERGSKL